MQRINQYVLYELGKALYPLTSMSGTVNAIRFFFDVYRAKSAVVPYCGNEGPVKLTIAKGAAIELVGKIDEVNGRNFVDAEGKFAFPSDATPDIPGWEVDSIRRGVETFEAVLRAEMQTFAAFAVPKRGIYDTEDLVNAADRAIPADLTGAMPPKALDEVASAGRCLAFGLNTAAGFHVCRGVEAVLEAYYQHFAGREKTLRGWHDYSRELTRLAEAKASSCPDTQTIAFIDQLRHSSRNPIMHPRVVLDEADAHTLFDLGKAVMCRMAQELKAACASTPEAAPAALPTAGAPLALTVVGGG